MQKRITDILNAKERTYSLEFFTPKTREGIEKLYGVIEDFSKIDPDWLSITYGAGGTTKEFTTDLVDEVIKRFNIPTIHHLTCVGHSVAELKGIIEDLIKRKIFNILALRGDPPKGVKDWVPAPDGYEYCYQLIELIKSYDAPFDIGVAGFPEGHIKCPDKETDSKHLKIKLDTGGSYVITQLFFDNSDYFEYVERVRKAGVTQSIVPGILPVTNYQGLVKFCGNCGATIPKIIHDIFAPIQDDEKATIEAGKKFAIEQCRELLEGGAPGLHFFTLNKLEPTKEIIETIR